MPPAPQFPLPPAVSLTEVAPGDFAAAEAGLVLHVVGKATASLTGDDAGLFRIDGMETLAIVKDPDAPQRDWETVSEAGGAGPVDGGPGFGVTVGFACPDQPAKETFTATAVLVVDTGGTSVTYDIPVTATVLQERLVVQLDPPSFFLGETKDVAVTVRSTYRRDISGLLSFGSTFPSAFSFGKLISAMTVPRLGSAGVTVPVQCSATATGDYDLTATFQPEDTAASAADTRDVRVLGRRTVLVTSGFAPQLTLLHPSMTFGTLGVTVISDAPATVFFEMAGAPETVSLTLPPSATVDHSAVLSVLIHVAETPTGFSDAPAPITVAWSVPPDDFHPEELKGSLVLSEVALPLRSRTVSSGELGSGVASGSATLLVQQDGSANFQGHVHNSGPLGETYVFAMAFTYIQDDQGRTPVFVHQGDLAGTLGGGGTRSDDWDITGPSDPALAQFIRDNWGDFEITGVVSSLDFNPDLFEAIEKIVAGMFAAAGVAEVVVLLS